MSTFHTSHNFTTLDGNAINGRLGELRKIFGDHNLKAQDCFYYK